MLQANAEHRDMMHAILSGDGAISRQVSERCARSG
jgi:hypothetical protein